MNRRVVSKPLAALLELQYTAGPVWWPADLTCD